MDRLQLKRSLERALILQNRSVDTWYYLYNTTNTPISVLDHRFNKLMVHMSILANMEYCNENFDRMLEDAELSSMLFGILHNFYCA